MATIITVHGTFSSGAEEGSQWWQRGSDFEKDIREFVEAEDGTLEFKPFVWDGKNSETSRRQSGRALRHLVSNLEKSKSKYVIIGHSHGGSVIDHFAQSQHWGLSSAFPNLSRWITVGTPFIHTKYSQNSQIALNSALRLFCMFYPPLLFCGALLFAATLIRLEAARMDHAHSIVGSFFKGDALPKLPFLALWAIAVIGSITTLLFKRRQQLAKMLHYLKMRLLECIGRADYVLATEKIWIPFNHRNDEAVASLSALASKKQPAIISRRFAVYPTVQTLLTTGVILIALLTSAVLLKVLFDASLGVDSSDFRSVIQVFYESLPLRTHSVSAWLGVEQVIGATIKELWHLGIVASVSAVVVFTLITYLVVSFLAFKASLLFSVLMSGVVNRTTWNQLKSNAYGSDVMSEPAVAASHFPAWLKRESRHLPEELEGEMTSFADNAAANSIGRLRSLIGNISTLIGEENGNEAMGHCLTWDELIHTVYFKIPRFRKLVCYTIAHSPGFRPSEKLKCDPDYERLGQWLAAIQVATPTSAATNRLPN